MDLQLSDTSLSDCRADGFRSSLDAVEQLSQITCCMLSVHKQSSISLVVYQLHDSSLTLNFFCSCNTNRVKVMQLESNASPFCDIAANFEIDESDKFRANYQTTDTGIDIDRKNSARQENRYDGDKSPTTLLVEARICLTQLQISDGNRSVCR